MGRRYTPSQCIVSFIVMSTLLTIISCVACAVLLLLAPGEPEVWVYHGGDYTFYPSLGLLIAAFVTLMISFVGCCGAFRDSKAALVMFSVCTFIAVGLYLASSTSIFVFAYTDKISSDLNGTLVSQMLNYSEGGDMDKLQDANECCGVQNYTDWRTYDTPWTRDPNRRDEFAPISCCKNDFNDIVNCTKSVESLYPTGCLDGVLSRLRPLIDAVLALTVVIAVIQAVTSFMSCYGAYLILKYEQYDIL